MSSWIDLELDRLEAALVTGRITYQEWLGHTLRLQQITEEVDRSYRERFGDKD
jgi:hypothetical protein